MSYQVVEEYDSIYQCICGCAEHTIQKRPDHTIYIDSTKYLSEMKEKYCAIDYSVQQVPEYLLVGKDDTNCTMDNYTACTLRTDGGRIYRFVIHLLTRKNKQWIYSSLHNIPNLYTSVLPGDILHLILYYV